MGEHIAISAIAETLLKRKMAAPPAVFAPQSPRTAAKESKPISPGMLATLGGLADAASTYAFMKTGRGVEQNPLVRGVAGSSPEKTGLAALGGLAATKGLTALLRKKWPRFADAIAANLGAEQLALAAHNTRIAAGEKPGIGSFSAYRRAFAPIDATKKAER